MMKNIKYSIVIFISLLSFSISSQTKKIEVTEVEEIIEKSFKLLKKYYVSEDVGIKVGNYLKKQFKKGAYSNLLKAKDLEKELTKDIRFINNDKHLSFEYSPQFTPYGKTNGKKVSNKVSSIGKWTNYGLQEIKILEGNIGFLKINHFSNWNHFKEAKEAITSAFNFLQNTDALIIDVTNNRGGYENIVAYLISYLYSEKPIHLSDYYVRFDNTKESLYTNPNIPGKKKPRMPVYVLVNSYTASAAESMAYMLKHLKRATVIGEQTMGAGHGAMSHKVSDNFVINISSEETINAVTKTSFEAVGVEPDIKIASQDAFLLAYKMALKKLTVDKKNKIHSSNYENIIQFLPTIEKVNKSININIYLGKYISEEINLYVLKEGDNLFARINGKDGLLKLIHKENHIFIVEGVKQRIEFTLNADEEVIGVSGIDSPMKLKKVIVKNN